MNTRKSLLNLSLFKNIIKNHLFFSKVSLIVYLGCFILALVSNGGAKLCLVSFGISAVVLTTLYPCFIQSYLINKTSCCFTYSLPISNKELLITNYLAGYVIVLVTLLIEGAGIIVIDGTSSTIIIRFIIAIFALLFIYYTIAYLGCCIAGSRLGQVVFCLVIYVLPIVIVLGFLYLSSFVIPYTFNNINVALNGIVPVVSGVDYISNGSWYIFGHVILASICLPLTYYVYCKRANERVGEAIIFSQLLIIIKFGLVLVITIGLFCSVLLISDSLINYGISSILMLLMIFLLIGLVVSLVIEIIFKSNHKYHYIMFYLGLLAIVFGVNYIVSNNYYLSVIGTNNLVSTLYYSTDLSIELSSKDTKKFVKYLDNNREKLYYYNDSLRDEDYMYLSVVSKDGNYDQYTYMASIDTMIDFFDNEGKDCFKEIFNFNDSITKEKYISTYYNDHTVYLKMDEVKEILVLSENNNLTPSNLLDQSILQFYGNTAIYNVLLDEDIDQYLANHDNLIRYKQIQDAYNFMNEIPEKNLVTLKKLISDKINYQVKYLYFNNYSMIDFDDSGVYFKAELELVGYKDEIKNVSVSYKLVREDDKLNIVVLEVK